MEKSSCRPSLIFSNLARTGISIRGKDIKISPLTWINLFRTVRAIIDEDDQINYNLIKLFPFIIIK